jgi:hypothetical protein
MISERAHPAELSRPRVAARRSVRQGGLVRILRPTSFLPIVLLTTLATLLLAPADSSAAADPVLSAIASAKKAHKITFAETKAFRATWLASGSAARRAPSAQRRKEIANVRAYTTKLARRHMLTPDRIEPVLLSVKATTYVMRYVKRFPRHEQDMTIPGELAVFKYYSGRGVQWQPFETLKQAMGYVTVPVPQTQHARDYAKRLLELAVPRNGALTWEYYFAFGGPSTPWISSLSQALATEFFQRVSSQLQLALTYPDEEYIETGAPTVTQREIATLSKASEQAMRAFLLAPSRGGLSVRQGTGRWFLLYPFNRAQRILNGHLQVLINVERVADVTKSPAAKSIVAAGVRSVVPLLPRFDTGGWSRYQLGQEADLNYHDFMTSQFKKLGAASSTIPQRDVFHAWYDKLSDYRVTAPEITVDTRGTAPIIPVIDGFRDTSSLSWTTDKRSRDTVVITAANGKPVRRLTVQGGTGRHFVSWNGRNSANRMVPAGTYSAAMDSVDIIGNRRHTLFPQKLIVLIDTEPPAATSFQLIARGKKSTTVRVVASDQGSAYIDARVELGGRTVGHKRGGRYGAIDVTVPYALASVHGMTLKLRDSSGNTTVIPLRTPIVVPAASE